MFVYNNISPTDLSFESKQPGPDLHSVSRSLEDKPRPRNYSPLSYVSDCRSAASATPPLHELHYLRTLCLELGHEEWRDSIPEWTYWRTEAEFFAGKVRGGEIKRQNLQDSDYWKAEAHFWEANCLSSNAYANRHDLADLRYWRRESSFWKSCYQEQEISSPSHVRNGINEAPYWRTEYSHLRDLLQAFARPVRSDRSFAQTASPPPLPNHPSADSLSMSGNTLQTSSQVSRLKSVPPRQKRRRLSTSLAAGSPRRSERLQARQRHIKQATRAAAGTVSTRSANVKESRVGKS